MDEEVREEDAEKEFQKQKEEREKKDDEKLSKNRAKREKAKMRSQKKKAGGDAAEGGKQGNGDGVKKKLGPAKIAPQSNGTAEDAYADGSEQAVPEEVGITIHDDD